MCVYIDSDGESDISMTTTDTDTIDGVPESTKYYFGYLTFLAKNYLLV